MSDDHCLARLQDAERGTGAAEIAAERFAATSTLRPPHDPTGARIRA